MAFRLTTHRISLLTFFTLLTISVALATGPQFPCFFIFGDSLVDNGNNNNLVTSTKVNYPPYGADFPQGPTGRFTNGQNIVDFIASLLGFDTSIPPYASMKRDDVLRGINYASGSAGIRNETGVHLGNRIPLEVQLINHRKATSRLAESLGNSSKPADHLRKCLYYFNVGSNDYINNYFKPEYYNSSKQYNQEQYATDLIKRLSRQLETLYHLGSRKVALSAVLPIGCLPAFVAQRVDKSTCVESVNNAVKLFNTKLKMLVNKLNDKYPDAKYAIIDAKTVNLPTGLKFLVKPCCKVSKTTGLCIKGEPPCLVRDLYLFFDNFHPTQIANKVLAAAAYKEIAGLINQ